MAKDTRIPIRLPSALKEEFEWAAARDDCKGVSTWLRQLGEERAEELRVQEANAGATMEDAIAAQRRRNGAISQQIEHREPEPPRVFIPGLGLDEEA